MNREKIANFIGGLKIWQKGLIAFAFVGVIVLLLVIFRPNNMEVLYTNLTPEDTNAIRNELNASNIPYQIEEEEKTIKVDRNQIDQATMVLAEKGLPKDEAVGYELFNEASMFASSAQQKVQYKYTTINEIQNKVQRSFGSFLDKVTVSLDFQQDESLWEEDKIASATVNVHIKNNKTLSDEQVKSIQHMVAGNLVNLSAEEVVVTDGNGYTYDVGNESYEGTKGYSKQQDVINQTEKRIAEDIKKTLNQNLLPQNYTLNLRVNIDFDEVVKNIETVDPKGTIVSKEERKETTEKSEGEEQPEPGTESNGDVPDYEQAEDDSEASYKQDKSEIIENYEVGKMVETIKQNPEVSKMFVTVTINKDAIDENIKADRLQQYTDEWSILLANAVGIEMDKTKQFVNGNVVVQVKDYAKKPNNVSQDSGQGANLEEGISNQDIVRMVSIIIAIALILFILFMVFGPRLFPKRTPKSDKTNVKNEETETSMKTAPMETPRTKEGKNQEDELVDLPNDEKMKAFKEGKINAQMKKQYTEEVYRLADENPQKTAEYLRTKIKEG